MDYEAYITYLPTKCLSDYISIKQADKCLPQLKYNTIYKKFNSYLFSDVSYFLKKDIYNFSNSNIRYRFIPPSTNRKINLYIYIPRKVALTEISESCLENYKNSIIRIHKLSSKGLLYNIRDIRIYKRIQNLNHYKKLQLLKLHYEQNK